MPRKQGWSAEWKVPNLQPDLLRGTAKDLSQMVSIAGESVANLIAVASRELVIVAVFHVPCGECDDEFTLCMHCEHAREAHDPTRGDGCTYCKNCPGFDCQVCMGLGLELCKRCDGTEKLVGGEPCTDCDGGWGYRYELHLHSVLAVALTVMEERAKYGEHPLLEIVVLAALQKLTTGEIDLEKPTRAHEDRKAAET